MAIDLEAGVMRKVAWRLVPFLSIGYLINALDRFNISIAALTMNKALGLSATAYGLGAGAFFWSYVLFQVPRTCPGPAGGTAWLTIIMVVWGPVRRHRVGHRRTSFVTARFLLGMAEAGYFPGVAFFMTCWFPARYRGRMMGIFFAFGAVSSVIGAPFVGQPAAAGRHGRDRRVAVDLPGGRRAGGSAGAVSATRCCATGPAGGRLARSQQERTLVAGPGWTGKPKPRRRTARVLRAILNPQIIVLTIAFTFTTVWRLRKRSSFAADHQKAWACQILAVGYVQRAAEPVSGRWA